METVFTYGWEQIGRSGHARPANPLREEYERACRKHDQAVEEYIANRNPQTLAALREAEDAMNAAFKRLYGNGNGRK